MEKRGNISLSKFAPALILFVTMLIILTMGADVNFRLADDACGNLTVSGQCEPNGLNEAYNMSNSALSAYQNMSNLTPILGIIMIAAFILAGIAVFGGRI